MKRKILAPALSIVLVIFIVSIITRKMYSWYHVRVQASRAQARITAKETPLHPTVPAYLTLTGFKGVSEVAFPPGNTKLVTADSEGKLILWNLKNKKPLLSYQRGQGVGKVIISKDGKFLISGGIEIWDAKTGKWLRAFDNKVPREAIIESLEYNPYTPNAQKDYVKKTKVPNGMSQMTASPDGKYIAIASEAEAVVVLDAQKGKLRWLLKGHKDGVQSVAFSSDNKFLASGSSDETVKIWDMKTGKLLRTLKGPADTPQALTFTSADKNLVSADQDGEILTWNVRTGSLKKKYNVGSIIPYAVFSTDGKRLLTQMTNYGLADNQIEGGIDIYDTMSGQMLYDLNVDGFGIQSYALSNDGKLAAVSGAEYNQKYKNGYRMVVKVWKLP